MSDGPSFNPEVSGTTQLFEVSMSERTELKNWALEQLKGKPIVLMCTMEEELEHLAKLLPALHSQNEKSEYQTTWQTELNGQQLIVSWFHYGLEPAQNVTTQLIDRYKPGAIINFGCTGAHRVDLLPGDVVIASDAVNLDKFSDPSTRYQAEPHLLTAAKVAANELDGIYESWQNKESWPDVPLRKPKQILGTIGSSDKYDTSPQAITTSRKTSQTDCEDMEAAGIAAVSQKQNIPFVAIKDISNNELLRPTKPEDLIVETKGEMGKRAAQLTIAMVTDLTKMMRDND